MSEHARRFRIFCSGFAHIDGIIAEIRHREIAQQKTAIRMRIGSHTPVARWRKFGEFRHKFATLIEELFRLVTFHPLLELGQVLWMLCKIRDRNLMCSPGIFDWLAIDDLWPGPAFGSAQNNHRPSRKRRAASAASRLLDGMNLVEDGVQRLRHEWMHRLRIVAFDEIRFVAIAGKQLRKLFVGQPGEHGGVRDFVAVQMQDGQNSAVARGIQEFVAVPACGERASLRFAVSDHAANEQVGIIERGAIGVCDGIPEFAAFMNRTGSFRRDMAWNSSWKGKLLEQFPDAVFGLRNMWIELAVRSFQVSVGHKRWSAVSGA